MAAALWVAGFFGCNQPKPTSTLEVDALVAQFREVSNDTVEEVEQVVANAAQADRAVMFIDLDWALTALYYRTYAQFMIKYHARHPTDPLHFHFVDCTPITIDYKPLRELPGWQELIDESGTALIHGCGEIVWLDQGRVIHVQQITDFNSAQELVKLTEQLMPATDNPKN